KTGQLVGNPIAETLRSDRRAIATSIGLTAFMAVAYYLPFVWLPTWLAHINRPPLAGALALTANTIALALLLVLTPLMALISERVGGRRMFLASALTYGLASYPIFLLMAGGGFTAVVLGGVVFAVACSLFAGCMAAVLADLFPTQTRYSGVAIA